MKVTVRQYSDFFKSISHYFDNDSLYVTEETVRQNGVILEDFDPSAYPDDDVIEIVGSGGYFCSMCDSTAHFDGKSVVSMFKKWLRQQGLKQYAFSVPLSKVADFEAACVALGVEIK
jgi:hypothetical protein